MKGQTVAILNPLKKSRVEGGSKEHELHGKKSGSAEPKQQILFLLSKKISSSIPMAWVGQIADRAEGLQNSIKAYFFSIPGNGCLVGCIVDPYRNNTIDLHQKLFDEPDA